MPDTADDFCRDLWRLKGKTDRPQTHVLPEGELLSGVKVISAYSRALGGRWESVGPVDIAGAIVQVAIDPADHNTIYAAAQNGGLWRLDNVTSYPTSSWIPLTDYNDSLNIRAFVIAPSNNRVIYIADGLGHLLRSDDRGRTWILTSATHLGWVRKIFVNPLDSNDVFVGSGDYGVDPGKITGGFWRSRNGGASWENNPGLKTLFDADITDVAIDPDDASIFYFGVRKVGLYKFRITRTKPKLMFAWSNASAPVGTMIRVAVGGEGTDVNRTVAVKFDQEIFVNKNGGRSVKFMYGGPWLSKGKNGEVGQGDWGNVIAIDPSNNDVILAGSLNLFRTDDGGKEIGPKSWEKVAGLDLGHEDQQCIVFDPKNSNNVYLSNDGGVYRSTDNGKTWNDMNCGLVTAQFFHVGLCWNVALGNIFHSGIIGSPYLDKGKWPERGGHGWEFSDIYSDPNRLFTFYAFRKPPAIGDVTALSRKKYRGDSTSSDIIDIANFKTTAIAVDTRWDSNTLLVGGEKPGRIMRAKDGDKDAPKWVSEPGIDIGSEAIVSISFAPSSPGMAYAVSSSGRVFRKYDVNEDDDWELINYGHVFRTSVLQLSVNALHDNRIYLMSGDELVRLVDMTRGTHTEPIMGSGRDKLPPSPFKSLLVHPDDGRTIFLAADVGVFISIDEGEYWFPYDRGLPNAEINEILWGQDGWLYAATLGRGLWRRLPSI